MTADRDGIQPYVVKDPEAFARNLALVTEEIGQALAAYLRAREDGTSKDEFVGNMAEIVKTFSKVGEYWMSDPARAIEAQSRLMARYVGLWSHSFKKISGEQDSNLSFPKDKRFSDPDWDENPIFEFLKGAYFTSTEWLQEIVDEADIEPHAKHKADFYTRQITGAVSPSNFFLTNPEVLRETIETNGENLVRGMKMLAEDIEAGKGNLRIRQSDNSKFAVGENLALTPGKVIAENDVCQLLQYSPTTEKVLKRPLLIVPPWINKFYILDLNPEKSFIRWCVEQGHTVFVISWVNPDARQAEKSFEHYMKEGILNSLDIIKTATGEKDVNAIGYCVGGTLLAVTLAYMAAKKDTRIKSATFFTTQVDFENAGDLKVFADEDHIVTLEASMSEKGYLDGSKMSSAFNMLRPNDLIWPYFVNNYLRGREPFPFDLLYWNSDCTRMPAANHSFYIRNCYIENKLSTGKMVVAGETLDLSKVNIPIMNIATKEDHIAPPLSVYIGSKCFGGDKVKYLLAGSGHIAGVVNPPSKNKYQYWVDGDDSADYENWVATAQEHPGSWWPYWHQWAAKLAPKMIDARTPGDGSIEPIEDAPGRYVRERT